MKITDFTIAVPDAEIAELHRRLAGTRWPDAVTDGSWADGTDITFLRELVDHWRTGYDWREHEARLNGLDQYLVELDRTAVHVVHERGTGPDPLPLVMTHGWPGSGLDMAQILPLLTDPVAHGADAADAFDVVVPSIPGHGFSAPSRRPDLGPRQVADLWDELMTGLGYRRYGVQAADWGASVSSWLAARHPEHVLGMHLNFIPGGYRPPLEGAPPVTDEESAFLDRAAAWVRDEGGYAHLHSTKPQTPAYALNDSPAGLASWIAEKMRGWSDPRGSADGAFTRDEILTNVSVCWFTATIASSIRFYRANRLDPLVFHPGDRIRTPTGIAAFPEDLMPPRSWVERVYDVQHWTDMPYGGHFGAQEAPELLAREIRAFFRPLRRQA